MNNSGEATTNLTLNTADLTFPFLKAPYDVRRLIYDSLFPSNTTLELTYQAAICDMFKTGEEIFKLSNEAIGLLRSCHQVNAEVTRIFYGKYIVDGLTTYTRRSHTYCILHSGINVFVAFPGHRAYDKDFRSAQMIGYPAEEQRPSTQRLVKTLYICVGYLRDDDRARLYKALVEFPKVIVVPGGTRSLPFPHANTLFNERRKEACRAIAEVRAGLESGATLWDHCGFEGLNTMIDGDIKAADLIPMLNEIMPNGYCSVEGSVDTVDSGLQSLARSWKTKRVLRRVRSVSQEL